MTVRFCTADSADPAGKSFPENRLEHLRLSELKLVAHFATLVCACRADWTPITGVSATRQCRAATRVSHGVAHTVCDSHG